MLGSRITTTPRAFALVLAGVFFSAAVLSMTIGMQTDEHGNMPNCPLMSEQASFCSMGVVEHIAKWQQLFTAAFSQLNNLASIVSLLCAFILLAFLTKILNIASPALTLSPPVFRNKPEKKLFNRLIIAFSQGILHPRLYA